MGTEAGRQEVLGKRVGSEQSYIGTAGVVRRASQEPKNINERLHLWGLCRCMGVSTGGGRGKGQGVERPTFPIRFGTYSIRNGRNGGLKSGLRGMSQANMDLSVFQENKLKNHIYTCESSGYNMVAMEELREHSGGVAIFYWNASTEKCSTVQ